MNLAFFHNNPITQATRLRNDTLSLPDSKGDMNVVVVVVVDAANF